MKYYVEVIHIEIIAAMPGKRPPGGTLHNKGQKNVTGK
jgi:hypothetical protein